MATVALHVGNVRELFEITGRGIIVITDVAARDWPRDLRGGHQLEIRNRALPPVRITIVGIEHASPFDETRPIAFKIGAEVARATIEVGAELWRLGDARP